ncbi:MAG: hypothetical protein HCTETUND1_103 [Candidatus Hodgkinia cicadicola]|nr:MAG: hypothetical protein HCTETUND1_103 [Candidatus Hodgkinia cicadicola]
MRYRLFFKKSSLFYLFIIIIVVIVINFFGERKLGPGAAHYINLCVLARGGCVKRLRAVSIPVRVCDELNLEGGGGYAHCVAQ